MAQNVPPSLQAHSVTAAEDDKKICPVVGTYANSLPLNHPPVNLSVPGQCPIVGATTEHHDGLLHAHPPVDTPEGTNPNDATFCPALSKMVKKPEAQKLEEAICPIVGTTTTILPPGHPTPDSESRDAVCPRTKATVGHHLGKVNVHPDMSAAPEGSKCPVVGAET